MAADQSCVHFSNVLSIKRAVVEEAVLVLVTRLIPAAPPAIVLAIDSLNLARIPTHNSFIMFSGDLMTTLGYLQLLSHWKTDQTQRMCSAETRSDPLRTCIYSSALPVSEALISAFILSSPEVLSFTVNHSSASLIPKNKVIFHKKHLSLLKEKAVAWRDGGFVWILDEIFNQTLWSRQRNTPTARCGSNLEDLLICFLSMTRRRLTSYCVIWKELDLVSIWFRLILSWRRK